MSLHHTFMKGVESNGMSKEKKKKEQAKVFFDKNYNKFSIHDVYEFAMKRHEYEERNPSQAIKTKYNEVDD